MVSQRKLIFTWVEIRGGKKINDVIVSFDGDYGWGITQPDDHA